MGRGKHGRRRFITIQKYNCVIWEVANRIDFKRYDVMRLTVAVVAVLIVVHHVRAESGNIADERASVTERIGDSDYADDGDAAPFTILVEHGDGWRCFASLVSLHTAVTSAWCARGRSAQPSLELWARPAHALNKARRVVRLAFIPTSEAVLSNSEHLVAGDFWSGAAEDIAVLELDEPFGEEAHVRPILMATLVEECAPSTLCHTVHAIQRRGKRLTIRIVNVAMVAGGKCAALAPRWPSLRSSALCLVGSSLCAGDWGAGVVCDGKLCGVVSRSAGADRSASCGETHIAQSVPRWRRFLHCAHTLRACERDIECAQQCVEKQLLKDTSHTTLKIATDAKYLARTLIANSTSTTVVFSRHTEPHRTQPKFRDLKWASKDHKELTTTQCISRSQPARTQLSSIMTLAPSLVRKTSFARAFEFEPNRPDFKAGEYGENVAEYDEESVTLTKSGEPTRTQTTETTSSGRPLAPAEWQLPASRKVLGPVPTSLSSSQCDPLSLIFVLCSVTVFLCTC